MASKLGGHVIRPTPEAVDWARVSPVVKALDDTTALRQAGRASVRIFRRYFPDQDINRSGADVLDTVLVALGDAPATHVELFNECFQRLGQGLERYVAFTREAVAALRLRRPDLTLVAFCFSTGQPEREDWEYLRQHEYGGASVIGIHEYWGNAGFTPWHALRHRKAHEWTNGDHPPFLITECGRDRVEGGKGGWIADGLTEEAYLTELLAYEGELMADPYVIAATPFTGGPTPDWKNFDTDPISGRLAALSGPLPPTPPVEVPVSDIVLSVPTRTQHAADGNWGKGETFGPCRGVVLHSTGGSARTLETEYINTANWGQNPDAGVSWHRLVGGGKFSEVCTTVHDHEKAYGAREPANSNRRHIELAHPDGPEWVLVAYPTFQYEAAGELIARWKIADAARGWVWPIKLLSRAEAAADLPGIVMHKDLPGGIGDGRRDPTPPFDPVKMIAAATRWHTKLAGGTMPTDPTALRDKTWALADQLQKLGAEWKAAGYPHHASYVENQGEAIKDTVAISKQEP